MNLLDENIPSDQHELLRLWGIASRVIGQDAGRLSISDDNIIGLLHGLKRPTFFTRDEHFFKPELRHPSYCLAWLDLAPEEAAMFIRRFLRHPRFDMHAKRLGIVARVHHDGIHLWAPKVNRLQTARWTRSS